MRSRILAACFALAVVLCASASSGTEPTKEEIALGEAQKWLAMVDGEQYGASWEAAAGYFRNAVTKEDWIASMNAYRKPLGKTVERKVRATQYLTAVPGAPDGEYVVIEFDASFEHKKKSVETITPMLDPDGAWRVSGYFIK